MLHAKNTIATRIIKYVIHICKINYIGRLANEILSQLKRKMHNIYTRVCFFVTRVNMPLSDATITS